MGTPIRYSRQDRMEPPLRVRRYNVKRGASVPARSSSPAAPSVQRYGGRIRDIQALNCSFGRNECSHIAVFPHQPPNPRSFRTEHNSGVSVRHSCGQRLLPVAAQSETPEPEACKLLQRTGDVDDVNVGNEVERARGCFGQDPGLGWAMTILHDDAGGAKNRSGTQDGPYVVRVGYLIQDDQNPGPPASLIEDCLKRPVWQSLAEERNPLMHGARWHETCDRFAGGKLMPDRVEQGLADGGHCVFGQHGSVALAHRIGERCADGMKTVQPVAAGRRSKRR